MSESTTASILPPERLGPFPRAGLLDTLLCRDKKNGRILKINEKDFGGTLFPKAEFVELSGDELDDLALEEVTIKAPPVRHSLYSEGELATLRVSDLKKLPEFEQLSDSVRKKLRTKQNYVDALLQVREDVPETAKQRATF